MASATFNDVTIGDGENGILAIRPGNIVRDDAQQTIAVEAWRHCATTVERLGYIENIVAAVGKGNATLAYTGEGGVKTWTRCQLASTKEDESSGPYVKFTLVFVREFPAQKGATG